MPIHVSVTAIRTNSKVDGVIATFLTDCISLRVYGLLIQYFTRTMEKCSAATIRCVTRRR